MSVYYKDNADWFIRAVNSMLRQTVPPSDFVLVCDGALSAELDAAIADVTGRFPSLIRVIRLERNMGLGTALATGMKACRHELVARMDSDDIAAPDRMEHQLARMRQEPSLAVLGGQIAEFSASPDAVTGIRRVPLAHADILRRAGSRNPMNHMTVTLRRSEVLKAGNYRDVPYFEDYDLWARMLSAEMRFANLDRVCVYARVNDNSFRRRGGWRYFRCTCAMERRLLSAGIIGAGRYLLNIAVRFAGTCLVPNSVRAGLYRRVLRARADRPDG